MLSGLEVVMETDQSPPVRAEKTWEGGWPQTRKEFERLVVAFQDRLVRYVSHRLGSLQDAEDVAQEVFVRAYAGRMRYKKVRHVSAYLYSMASHLCTDTLRKRKRRKVSLDEPAVQDILSIQPTASEAASAAEDLYRIEALLRQIPRRQAEVVRLRVLDELSMNEISKITGCSRSTAKSRLRYGLEKLRKIVLQGKGESP